MNRQDARELMSFMSQLALHLAAYSNSMHRICLSAHTTRNPVIGAQSL